MRKGPDAAITLSLLSSKPTLSQEFSQNLLATVTCHRTMLTGSQLSLLLWLILS